MIQSHAGATNRQGQELENQRTKDVLWEAQLAKLQVYMVTHGNCKVPKCWADKNLGTWVKNQRLGEVLLDRGGRSRGMTQAKVAKLGALGFWEDCPGGKAATSDSAEPQPAVGAKRHADAGARHLHASCAKSC